MENRSWFLIVVIFILVFIFGLFLGSYFDFFNLKNGSSKESSEDKELSAVTLSPSNTTFTDSAEHDYGILETYGKTTDRIFSYKDSDKNLIFKFKLPRIISEVNTATQKETITDITTIVDGLKVANVDPAAEISDSTGLKIEFEYQGNTVDLMYIYVLTPKQYTKWPIDPSYPAIKDVKANGYLLAVAPGVMQDYPSDDAIWKKFEILLKDVPDKYFPAFRYSEYQ